MASTESTHSTTQDEGVRTAKVGTAQLFNKAVDVLLSPVLDHYAILN